MIIEWNDVFHRYGESLTLNPNYNDENHRKVNHFTGKPTWQLYLSMKNTVNLASESCISTIRMKNIVIAVFQARIGRYNEIVTCDSSWWMFS